MRGIDHINIVVRDLDRVASFFECLGFVRQRRDALEGAWISRIVDLPEVKAEYIAMEIPGTPTKLELIRYDHPLPEVEEGDISVPNRLGYRHLAVIVDDIEETIENLGADHIHCFSDPVLYEPTGKSLLYLRGPENILVELAAYSNDR